MRSEVNFCFEVFEFYFSALKFIRILLKVARITVMLRVLNHFKKLLCYFSDQNGSYTQIPS